jgi:FkbM family methyltransferase
MLSVGTHEEWGDYRPRGLAALGIGLTRRRIVRGALRRLVGNTVSGLQPCFDVTVDGIEMRCVTNDNPTEWGLTFTGSRQDGRSRTLILTGLERGDVFVDVGANCGAFSLFAARLVGAHGRVIAIEPMPEMAERLRFNMASNGFSSIDVLETAVGPQAGHATLYVDEVARGHSSMVPIEGYKRTTVPTTTLQAIVEASGVRKIDALKIDIEGFEDRALLPFIASADRSLWPKRIFMETTWASRWQNDCVDGLTGAGYREAWSGHGDILLVLPDANAGLT